ncbi:MAG: hypothetical protein AB1349_11765 [Elusimicrobiota bacterium]
MVIVKNGIFQVFLGEGTAIPSDVFTGGEMYLQIQVGTEQPLMPRQKMASVGYAFKSETAEKSTGDFNVGNDLKVTGKVGIGAESHATKLHVKTDADIAALFENGDNPIVLLKDADADIVKYDGLRLNGNLLGLWKMVGMDDGKALFNDIMSINANTGNVGIGQIPDSDAKLDVSGNVKMSSNISINYATN